jgi:2,4-dienoyl-CoA reductase-like NADH-dependent reductase (Old Yellow Enzyme family)
MPRQFGHIRSHCTHTPPSIEPEPENIARITIRLESIDLEPQPMSPLFQPLQIGALQIPNRIVIPPMCQYSAVDGCASDWHLMHVGGLAVSGAGLLILEATGVSPEARITAHDLGLYSDASEAALARVIDAVRSYAPTPIAVQLAHAGRKASSRAPWDGGQQALPHQPGGWKCVAPSALPHAEGEDAPLALDTAGLRKVVDDFAAAAQRAVRAGCDGIELHMAHGYLLHQFLSPLANQRDDAYGGSLENRMRLPLEVFDAVRAALPAATPVWVRVSATDWVDGGWDLDGTLALARALEARGCAALHVSSGGVSTRQVIKLEPGYQVGLARAVKAAVGIPVIAVGLITSGAQAQAIVEAGDADAVAIGRAMLFDPRWGWHAAAELGAQVQAPPQYWRSAPAGVKDLFVDARIGMR